MISHAPWQGDAATAGLEDAGYHGAGTDAGAAHTLIASIGLKESWCIVI